MNHDPALELVLDFLASRRWRDAENAVRRAALSTEQSTDENGRATLARNSHLDVLVGGPQSASAFGACGACGSASQAVVSGSGLTYASRRRETQPPSPIRFHDPAHDAESDQWDGDDDAGYQRVEASEEAVVRELTRSASGNGGGLQPPRSARATAGVPSREGFETFEQVFGERELEETVGAGVEAWIGNAPSWMGQAGYGEPPSSVEVTPSEAGESGRDDVDAMEQLSEAEQTSKSPPTARLDGSSASDEEAPAEKRAPAVVEAPAEVEPMEHAPTGDAACEAAACETAEETGEEGVAPEVTIAAEVTIAPEVTIAAEAGSADVRGDGSGTARRTHQSAAAVPSEAAADVHTSAYASAEAGDGGAAGSRAGAGAVGVAEGGVAEGVSRLSMSTRGEGEVRIGADAAVTVEGEAVKQQQWRPGVETAMETEMGKEEGATGSVQAEGEDDSGREGVGGAADEERGEEAGAERAGVVQTARAREYESEFEADAEETDGDGELGELSAARSMPSEKSERSVRLSEASVLIEPDHDDADDSDGEEDEEEVLESDPEIDPYERAATQAAIYETLELKVIHERRRTGFEEYKDFPIRINSVIAARYWVKEYLGSAAFSKAIQCLDLQTGEMVCIKIIKNSKDFFDQSLDEIKLLRCLRAHDPDDKHHVLRMYDSFYHKEHLFIVCELLRDNLYEFSKYNRESGGEAYFTLPRLRAIAKQCLEALVYVHSLGLIHCDLKPENILIKSYSRCEVKVIDFGSSCFSTDHLSSYVQSRSYRAPEVVLGLPYGEKIDVWSLGAIIAELFTGKVLFQNDSVATMLARIVSILGPFPSHMLSEGRHVDKYFVGHAVFEVQDDGSTQLLQPKATSLRHRLRCDDEGFLSFLGSLLKLDPNERPSARQALTHPWIARDPY